MRHGIGTDFLVAAQITDHPFHRRAGQLLTELLDDGHDFALAPQSLAEFIHIVTDSRRMPQPLSMLEATAQAEQWWQAREVVRVFPGSHAVTDFFSWLRRQHLGRKRLLDTMLAATFKTAGVSKVITNNARDFETFGCFEIVAFR